MRKLNYVIADVFTSRQFGGNQLAVFIDGRGVDSETMQEIAREMNYSETTFLLPAEEDGDFRLRIFTPATELPFAGHPIVGTANVIIARKLKEWDSPLATVSFETGVGLIQVEIDTSNGEAGHTTMTQPIPELVGRFEDKSRVAASLSLDISDIDARLPVEALSNGLTVLLIPVTSLRAVEKIKVDTRALEQICKEIGAKTVMAFSLETAQTTRTAHCRVFVPLEGIAEDAATGSAHGPLGFYLVQYGLVEIRQTTKIISEQGFEMKRPSLLHTEIDSNPATKQISAVRVGGSVVISGEGTIFLP